MAITDFPIMFHHVSHDTADNTWGQAIGYLTASTTFTTVTTPNGTPTFSAGWYTDGTAVPILKDLSFTFLANDIRIRQFPEPEGKTVGDILRLTKRLLEEHGWIQGQWISADGMCLDGALRRAATGEVYGENQIYLKARGIVDDLIESGIPAWNDQPYRTLEQVMALLDEAVEVAERVPALA